MDRVRFGRALGYGARHAAKSLAKAADAAVAPNPRAAAAGAGNQARARAQADEAFPANGAAAGVETAGRARTRPGAADGPGGASVAVAGRVAQARAGVRQGNAQAGQLRRHVWSPVAKFSGVVGLQVSGTFFAVVALYLSQGLWKTRGAIHLGLKSHEAETLYLHAVAFALFSYFAVSSFVRAHLKQRQ